MIYSGEGANFDVDMMCVRLQIFSEASAEWNVFFESSREMFSDVESRSEYAPTDEFIDASLMVLMP